MRPVWIGHSWTTTFTAVLPRVVSAQYGERPAWGAAGRIVHKLWVLDYARSNCGLARVGSPRSPWLQRSARTAHLYAPGTAYWEDTSAAGGPIREAWVVFAGGEEAGLARLLGRHRRFVRIADPAGLLDAPLHEMALAGHSMGESGFWRAQGALAELLSLIHVPAARREDESLVLQPPRSSEGREGGIVETAREYFRDHLAEPIRLATVARHLRMSPSAFSHKYALAAGQSPMAAVGELRIELAKNLLLRGLKMEAIARQTGFCDAFHLSKAFRKHCGLSPSEFRRGLWDKARGGE